MAQEDIWIQQANDAIRRGADPAKVEALLMEKMRSAGMDPKAPATAPEKKAEDGRYAKFDNSNLDKLNAVPARYGSGSVDIGMLDTGRYDTEGNMYDEDGRIIFQSPESKERNNAERRGAQMDALDAAKYGAQGVASRTLRGLGLDAKVPEAIFSEDQTAQKAGQAAGSLAAALPVILNPYTATGFGLTQGSAGYQEARDAGATKSGAALAGATEAALFPLQRLVPGALGGNLATRILTGAGLNVGAGIGTDAVMNAVTPDALKRDLLDPYSRIPDAILGVAAGAASRGARSRPAVRTGDPAIDAGINLVDEISTRTPVQGDLFADQPITSRDLFSGDEVPASLMEQRRIRQEQALRGEEAQRTEAENTQLERDYILDQQDRLNAQAQEGIVSRQGDIPEPFMGLADTIPADVNAPNPRQIFTREGETVGVRDQQPNSAMADAMLQGWIDRGQLRNESTPVPERSPEVFEPSRTPTVDQTPVQPSLDLVAQPDLFGNEQIGKPLETVIRNPEVAYKATKDLDVAKSREDLISAIKSGGQPLFAEALPDGKIVSKGAPAHLLDALRNDTLTVRQVFDEASKSLPTDPEAKQHSANLIKYAGALADRMGGKDTGFTVLDSNKPAHAQVLSRSGLREDQFDAFFDPVTNKIYIKPSTSGFNTLVHEAVHAVTSKMLYMGDQGDLKGPAQTAYVNLRSTFEDLLKPELTARASELPKGMQRRLSEYGLTNLDEFYSEFFSNGVFRNSLKAMKVTPEWTSKLSPILRAAVGKAKNLYDVVVSNFSKMMAKAGLRSQSDLGLAKNAESAYELMFARMDKLHNSIEDSDAQSSREINARNTTPEIDTSFLGEQVPGRDVLPSDKSEEPQAPRSRLRAGLRQAFATKGIEPKVYDARQLASGEQAAGAYRASTISNALSSGLDKSPELRDTVLNVMQGKEDPRTFLSSIKETNPQLHGAVRDFLNDRHANALEYARTIASNPNASAEQLAFAAKALKNSNTYIHRAYEANTDPPKKGVIKWMQGGYMDRKLQMANSAEAKLGKNERTNLPLTEDQKSRLKPEEVKNLEQLRAMRGWVSNWLKPTPEALNKMSVEDAGELYRMHTGLDPAEITRDIPSNAAKKDALITGYQDALSKNSDFNQFVDNTIKQLSGLSPDKVGAVIKYTQNMRLGSDVFSQRSNVPPALRAWWGEIKDPVAQAVQTLSTQTAQISQLKGLTKLRDDGLGTIFTEDAGSKTHTEILSGDKMGPLKGLRTTPDVKKSLDSILKIDQSAGDILDALVAEGKDYELARYVGSAPLILASKLSSAKKMSTIVFNQGRWAMNFLGSFGQTVSNGNLNLPSWKRGAEATLAAINSSGRKVLNPDVETLFRNNIWEPTQISEIYSGAGTEHVRNMLKKAAGSTSIKDMVKSGIDKGMAIAKEGYSSTDLWTKAANFFHDVDVWTEHFKTRDPSMTKEQIERFVAERTNNTNITPSRAPTVLKSVERLGGTQYLPYQYETFRTTINNLTTGLSDAKEGAKTGDMRLMRNGIQRLMGAGPAMLYSQTAFHAGLAASLSALGYAVSTLDPDDERRKHLDLDPSHLGSEVVVLTDDKGKEWTIDVGQLPPMDPAMRPTSSVIDAVMKLGQGDTKGAEKSITDAGKQMWGLVSSNSMYRNLLKTVTGKDPSTARSNPDMYDAAQKAGQELGIDKENINRIMNLTEIFVPKGAAETARAINSKTDQSIKNLIGGGLGVRELSPLKDLNAYFGYERKEKLQEAKQAYADMLKQNFPVAPEAVEKKFVSGLKDAAKPYAELQQAVRAAKEQGVQRKDLTSVLKGMGLSEDMQTAILRGRKFPVSFMITELEKDLEQRMLKNIDDPAKKTELRKLYRDNTRLINRLYKKYRNVDIEELVNGK